MVKNEDFKNHQFLYLLPLGVFIVSLLLFKFITMVYFTKYILLMHAIFELICMIISFMIFGTIWITYKQNSVEVHILGFGFLLISIFQFMHISAFNISADFSLWYLIFARIIETVILSLMFITKIQNLKIKKETGTIISLFFGIFVSILVYLVQDYLPVLYHINNFISLRMVFEIIFILFVVNCFYFVSKRKYNEIFSYRFIYQAIAFMFLTSISYILMGTDPMSYFNMLAHFMRVCTYILLYIGIFGRAVMYPYEKLEEILNHLPLAVGTFDSNYRLTFGNRRSEEIVGFYNKEFMGQRDTDILEKLSPSAVTSLQRISHEIDNFHNEIITLQNAQNKLINVVVDAYRLQSGGYLVVFDEAQRIQALDNMQLQTQTILNSINSSILIMDNNQIIIMCNKALAQDFGMEIEDIVGLHINELCEKLSVSEFSGKFNLQEPFEIAFQTIDGKVIDILMQMALIKNIDGEIIGSIGVGANITNFNKEKDEKQQQDKLALLGQMASGIVHEIKNPLTTILGFSNLIKSHPQSIKNEEFAAYIENEVKDLNKIVSDFLAFARPRTPVLKELALNDLVSSAKVLFESHLLSNQVAVNYDLAKNDFLVQVDENQIKQVILNIINNAVDVLSDVKNAEIRISTGYNSEKNESCICIYNNGPALTDEEKIKIGTPFFTTKSKGTGLGFSICQQIMKEHGGRINIKSEKDYGTAFELCFPAG